MGCHDRLRGLSALVTGAGAGIGAGVARRLAAEGVQVTVIDRNPDRCDLLIADYPDQIRAEVLDLTDFSAIRAAVARSGPFDILVNNAGLDQHAFFTRTTEQDWTRLLRINLEAVFAVTHAVLPAMQARRFGRIINVGSEAGRLGSRGGAVYAAAKGGLIAFSKSLALENARFGITVNSVLPGPIDTPLLRKAVVTGGDKLLAAMQSATLLGRLGTPDEVAAAVAFLASREAGYVTGETLGVSGGMGISQG
ncbi:SDR family NAD(P)-dependent oxidoreductase [Falsigemmobacter faecalis]|uniref:SDR family oxidoreductase n=1 Tax=Falsigemmobacter faecalis TaxID=2488730 RepID=A0A3P3DPV3_9RHOB|nr:SDR family oxidoreductase [Falsigemmobacter faecalis]RRH76181.1 SDR family oxidoreductase [Falsigemmobacter faecalis]